METSLYKLVYELCTWSYTVRKRLCIASEESTSTPSPWECCLFCCIFTNRNALRIQRPSLAKIHTADEQDWTLEQASIQQRLERIWNKCGILSSPSMTIALWAGEHFSLCCSMLMGGTWVFCPLLKQDSNWTAFLIIHRLHSFGFSKKQESKWGKMCERLVGENINGRKWKWNIEGWESFSFPA